MMTIKNFKDNLIQVQSDKLDSFISHLGSYDSIEITAKQGCNGTPVTTTLLTNDILSTRWVIDLDEAVKLNNKLYELNIKNFKSYLDYNVLTSSIDLGYVAANCTSPTNACTLEDFDGHFNPLFKNAIDAWFTFYGIVGVSTTVSFDGNKVSVTGIPSPFGIGNAGYGVYEATAYTTGGFSTSSNNVAILSIEGLFIPPSFFGDTVLLDEVYSVTLKYNKASNSGYTTESMCAFIDVLTKCGLAAALSTALSGSLSDDAESAILLHYGLTQGSNCGCNCDDLCTVYNQLLTILSVLTGTKQTGTNTDADCGC